MSSWHRLVPSSGDDHTCTQDGCGIVVADEVVGLLAIDCPARGCEENFEGVCIFTAVEDADGELLAECSYCGARGGLGEGDEEELDDAA